MAKNKGFRRRDAAQKQLAIDTGITMHQLVGQVDLDALILTLAYGECMGNDRWGQERIERFCLEWRQNTAYVYRGLDSEDPEADAVRADVDKRLFAKTTEDDRTPWPERYPMQQRETLEEEAKRTRNWRKRK